MTRLSETHATRDVLNRNIVSILRNEASRGNGFIVYAHRYNKFLEDTETISQDFALRLPG